MGINADALNPCLEMQKSVEKGLKGLRSTRMTMGPLKDAMEDITNTGGVIDGNLTDRVNDNLKAGMDTSLNSMGSLDETLTNLTGSCLEAVTGPLTDLADNAAGAVSDIMGSASSVADASELLDTFGDMTQAVFDTAFAPITSILKKVSDMDSLVKSLGIESALKSLDELLGCLSDSSCGELISPSEIDGYFSEINTFVSDFTLTDEGGIDMANILDAAGIAPSIASDIDLNANTLQSYTTDISMKAKNLVSDTASNLIPDDLF